MNDIRSARYVRDCVVHLEFDDGLERDLDLSSYLEKGPIFAPLAELPYFKHFTLGVGTLAWPNGADIAPERLYELTENASHVVERTR
jgi:Protein of unknown function (DUF2442)